MFNQNRHGSYVLSFVGFVKALCSGSLLVTGFCLLCYSCIFYVYVLFVPGVHVRVFVSVQAISSFIFCGIPFIEFNFLCLIPPNFCPPVFS